MTLIIHFYQLWRFLNDFWAITFRTWTATSLLGLNLNWTLENLQDPLAGFWDLPGTLPCWAVSRFRELLLHEKMPLLVRAPNLLVFTFQFRAAPKKSCSEEKLLRRKAAPKKVAPKKSCSKESCSEESCSKFLSWLRLKLLRGKLLRRKLLQWQRPWGMRKSCPTYRRDPRIYMRYFSPEYVIPIHALWWIVSFIN